MTSRTCSVVMAVAMAGVLALATVAWADDPRITTMVGQVDQAHYTASQVAIENMGLGNYVAGDNQGYRDRYYNTLGNQEARQYLYDQFSAMGLTTSLQGTYNNVVGELRGTETPERIYLVGAHYDSVSGTRPGGDDNASGTAGVLEAARVLSQYQFKSTLRFVGFNAEENGLLGSSDYVNNWVTPRDENIVSMISLDMILRPYNNANPADPIDLDLGCIDSPDDLAWAQVFRTAAGVYVPGLTVDVPYTMSWGASDHQPFSIADYAAFLAIENSATDIWGGANPYYHQADDWSQGAAGTQFDYGFATDVTQAVVATLGQEAGVVPEPATLSLLACGLAGLFCRRRRRGC